MFPDWYIKVLSVVQLLHAPIFCSVNQVYLFAGCLCSSYNWCWSFQHDPLSRYCFFVHFLIIGLIVICCHGPVQITGFAIAVVLFALMRQARQWELDQPIPSLISAVESNLRMPLPFLCFALLPILFALVLSCLISLPLPPAISFIIVSTICYFCANGVVVVVISASQLLFYVSASLHVFIKKRLAPLLNIYTAFMLLKTFI